MKRASARGTSGSTIHWHFSAALRLKRDRPGDGRVDLKWLREALCKTDIPLSECLVV